MKLWIQSSACQGIWTLSEGAGGGKKYCLQKAALKYMENIEEFLEKSGWRRDNPELCSECYLFENHICRKIQGKIWYFSRIQYENGLRGMKQGFN